MTASNANNSLNTKNLHQALQVRNIDDVFKLLQKKKIDFNLTIENRNPVLYSILENENYFNESDVIELLTSFLVRGADPNIENSRQETLIHLALLKRQKNIMNLLLKYGADINKKDNKGNTIAHYFIKNERKQFWAQFDYYPIRNDWWIIRKVLNYLFNFASSPIEETERESVSFTKWLISQGLDFDCKNNEGKSALHLSIDHNLQHVFLTLLDYTKDVDFVDKNGQTLFHLYLEVNYRTRKYWDDYHSRYFRKIVKSLLNKGLSAVALDSQNRSPLWMVWYGTEDETVFNSLIDHTLKTEKFGATSVFQELVKNCSFWNFFHTDYFLGFLRKMISNGANVNAPDKFGKVPLYYAFAAKNQSVINFLCDQCADFTAITHEGENLLHAIATRKPQCTFEYLRSEIPLKLLKTIVSKDCCDMNARNRYGDSPLHVALQAHIKSDHWDQMKKKYEADGKEMPLDCYETLVKELVERGANVNYKGRDGKRPLELACVNHYQSVPLLLKYGAYVNVRTSNGGLFFSLAIRCLKLSAAKLMLIYGADVDEHCLEEPGILYSEKETFIFKHWIKLKAADLPFSQNYADLDARLDEYEDYETFYQECLKEVEKLRSTFIASRISIYNFLHMGFSGRLIHINSKKLKDLVHSLNLEQQFPQYFVLILGSYRQTVTWKSLIEPAIHAWLRLTKIELPDDCIELILKHLTIADLVTFIEHN